MLRVTTLILLIVAGAAQTHARAQSGIDESSVRDAVRRMVQQLRNRLDVRVYEPIPTRIASAAEFTKILAKSFTPAPASTAASTAPNGTTPLNEANVAQAEATARTIGGHFLARYVRHGKSETLFVVPENLARILPTDQRTRSRMNRLLRFELARELTRMADTEKLRFKGEKGIRLSSAGQALIEARGWWAAEQLVAGARKRPTVNASGQPDATGPGAATGASNAERISICLGEGLTRALRLVERRFALGGQRALAALLDAPPTDWSDLPSLQEKRASDRLTPAARALDALSGKFTETGWIAQTETRTAAAIQTELTGTLTASASRKLAGRVVGSHRRSLSNPSLGMVTVTITEMQNASAAFAYMMAMQKVVNARQKRIEAGGAAIEIIANRPRDLERFPVLNTVTSKMGKMPEMMRTSGVTGAFHIEIVGPAEVTDWPRVREALEAMRSALDGQSPG